MTDVTPDDLSTPSAVKDDANKLKSKAQSTLSQAKDKAADAVDNAHEQLDGVSAKLRRTVEEKAAVARDWASEQGEVIRGQVTERPFIAVSVSAGAAFAAGLVVGLLLATRD